MTLEQITQWAANAAAAGDLASVDRALEARAVAIAELAGCAPTPELAARISAAIDAGAALDRDLAALKLRIGFESARLSQLQTGFIVGLGAPNDPLIDCRG